MTKPTVQAIREALVTASDTGRAVNATDALLRIAAAIEQHAEAVNGVADRIGEVADKLDSQGSKRIADELDELAGTDLLQRGLEPLVEVVRPLVESLIRGKISEEETAS